MKYANLKKAIEKYRDLVIEESKNNLSKDGKANTGGLYDKIKTTPVRVSKNSLEFNIVMPYYGTFVDKGVSGTKVKYNTPYSYTDKMPPTKVFDKWIVKKGIAPRTEGGQFKSRESLKFAIAKTIYTRGIKPSLFFTKPFEKYFKSIPQEITDAFGLDVSNFMSFIIKQNFKDYGKN